MDQADYPCLDWLHECAPSQTQYGYKTNFLAVALVGTIVLTAVAVTPGTAAGLLIAFCEYWELIAVLSSATDILDLANCCIVSGNLLWSLVTRNIAGQSKKVTTYTLMFCMFAAGNMVGPQVSTFSALLVYFAKFKIFQSFDAPRYRTAFSVHIALYGELDSSLSSIIIIS